MPRGHATHPKWTPKQREIYQLLDLGKSQNRCTRWGMASTI